MKFRPLIVILTLLSMAERMLLFLHWTVHFLKVLNRLLSLLQSARTDVFIATLLIDKGGFLHRLVVGFFGAGDSSLEVSAFLELVHRGGEGALEVEGRRLVLLRCRILAFLRLILQPK